MSDINVISQTQTIEVSPYEQSITVDPSDGTVVVVGPSASAISVTNSGPVGPPGRGAGYDYVQSSPSDNWVINHNLGYKPTVQVFTVGGLEIIGEIQHVSNNQVTVTFNTPLAGSARLI